MTARMRRNILAAAVAIWLLCAMTPAFGLPGVIRSRFFTVHYGSADPLLAQIVSDTAERQLRRIAKDLDYPLKDIDPFTVYAYPSHYEFVKAGGLDRRSTTVGTTRWGDETISVDVGDVFISTEEVLAHEITHAVVFRLLGQASLQLPTWFSEGLAKYESRESDTTDNDLVGKAAAENTLIPLPRLASGFPKDDDALAYAESASAVRYMVRRFGKLAPRRLLYKLKSTGSFEQAMQSVTGLNSRQFADQWYALTTRRYAGLRFSTIITGLISTFMAALVVAAFLVRRRQKIEAARRWELEEAQAEEFASNADAYPEP